MTDVSAWAERLGDLPEDLSSLCDVVRGVLPHGHLVPLYGLELDEKHRKAERNLRSAAALASHPVDLPALRSAYRDARWQVPATHPALGTGR